MNAGVVSLAGAITLREAAEGFLARRDLDGDTVRSYGQTMRRLCALTETISSAGPGPPLTPPCPSLPLLTWDNAIACTW